jgi:hypothetical protein
MENLGIIKAITEVGGIGVSVALMILFYKLSVMFNKSINNHMVHEEQSHEEQTKAMTGLMRAINSINETIKGCPHNK